MCRKRWRDQCADIWQQQRQVGEATDGAEMWSEAASESLYRKALSEGAAIANQSVSAKFEDGRRKTWCEYLEFLNNVGRGISVENACDLDVIAFVQGLWIPSHVDKCRTRTDTEGKRVPSASAVKGVVQHLAKSYAMLGFMDGENPAKQESVKSYCEGYRVSLRERGVREKRAKVFKAEKVTALITYLEDGIRRTEGIARCVLMMDLAAVDYLWESWARGKECGELRAEQVDHEQGVSLPGWSKTVHSEPSARIDLTEGGRGRFLQSAARLIGDFEKHGYAGGHGYLFRPLTRKRDGFEDSALSSNALRKRIQQHLKDAKLFDGETLHSFRRSAVQNAAAVEGYDVRRLMELGRLKSYAAFRVYVEEIQSSFSRS
jgi:integrase